MESRAQGTGGSVAADLLLPSGCMAKGLPKWLKDFSLLP
jgi:hypothetical protein